MKQKYRVILTISILFLNTLFFQNSSFGQYNSFKSEKHIKLKNNLNFLATIEFGGKSAGNCFTFFMTNKYTVTTQECAQKSITTIKKLADNLKPRDYYKTGSNGLLLNSVIKPERSPAKFSLIFTEKYINNFFNINFNYSINKSEKYYIPVVINNEFIYIYTSMINGDKAIINFKQLPDNCEILAGSPIFTENLQGGIGIVAMVSQYQPCSKDNSIPIVRSYEIASEIKKISNCVSYYLNLPGYIDNVGECNFNHYP